MIEGRTRIDLEMNNRGEEEKSLHGSEFRNPKMQVKVFLDSRQPNGYEEISVRILRNFAILKVKPQ